jgi:hypothetical protein
MRNRHRASLPVDSGNIPGNPLRSYRMSMLSHGFVDPSNNNDFELDESDSLSYSVIRIRNRTAPIAAGIAAFVLIVVVVTTIVIFA